MSSIESTYTIQPTIDVCITSQAIDDIMGTALDSITYWCCRAKVVGKYLGEYASDQISRGGTLVLYDAESSDKWELTLDKFLNGVKLAMEQGDISLESVRQSNYDIDGTAADTIIQYALFGEVVFG